METTPKRANERKCIVQPGSKECQAAGESGQAVIGPGASPFLRLLHLAWTGGLGSLLVRKAVARGQRAAVPAVANASPPKPATRGGTAGAADTGRHRARRTGTRLPSSKRVPAPPSPHFRHAVEHFALLLFVPPLVPQWYRCHELTTASLLRKRLVCPHPH